MSENKPQLGHAAFYPTSETPIFNAIGSDIKFIAGSLPIPSECDNLRAENAALKQQLEQAKKDSTGLINAAQNVSDCCFNAMEGAGMPEFEYYSDWYGLLADAVAKARAVLATPAVAENTTAADDSKELLDFLESETGVFFIGPDCATLSQYPAGNIYTRPTLREAIRALKADVPTKPSAE